MSLIERTYGDHSPSVKSPIFSGYGFRNSSEAREAWIQTGELRALWAMEDLLEYENGG